MFCYIISCKHITINTFNGYMFSGYNVANVQSCAFIFIPKGIEITYLEIIILIFPKDRRFLP